MVSFFFFFKETIKIAKKQQFCSFYERLAFFQQRLKYFLYFGGKKKNDGTQSKIGHMNLRNKE